MSLVISAHITQGSWVLNVLAQQRPRACVCPGCRSTWRLNLQMDMRIYIHWICQLSEAYPVQLFLQTRVIRRSNPSEHVNDNLSIVYM